MKTVCIVAGAFALLLCAGTVVRKRRSNVGYLFAALMADIGIVLWHASGRYGSETIAATPVSLLALCGIFIYLLFLSLAHTPTERKRNHVFPLVLVMAALGSDILVYGFRLDESGRFPVRLAVHSLQLSAGILVFYLFSLSFIHVFRLYFPNDMTVRLSKNQVARWRGRTVGIVFQFFQLLPTLTAMENIMLAMDFSAAFPVRERKPRALALLERVGSDAVLKTLGITAGIGESILLDLGGERTAWTLTGITGEFLASSAYISPIERFPTAMSLNVLDRTRELGIMRAIGATTGTILQVIITEGAFTGVLGWIPAVVPTVPYSALMGRVFILFLNNPIDIITSISGGFIWPGFVVVLSAVASALPAWAAAREPVRETLVYE